MQNQKDGKLTINNIIIGVNNKEILVEKLKRDILEQKNKYKISEYIIIEMEKDEETITYNTTEEFKDVYTEIVLPNTIISFDPFMLEKTIENVLKKQENEKKLELEIQKIIEENILNTEFEYDYNNKILENIEIVRVSVSSEKTIHEYLRQLAISDNKNDITIFDEKDKQELLLNNSIDIGIYLRKYIKILAEILEIKEAINQTETLKIKLESEYNYSRRR